MTRPVIKAEGLWKEYVIGAKAKRHDTFYDQIASSFAAPFRRLRQLKGEVEDEQRFWALRDVSFELNEGEVLGIIGRNGAGKSTLLKILSRITAPTKGRAEIRGRVASLLEVGTGFHPQLTGRENVYLNGAILGMSRAEVERRFDEIVAFSGLETFIDTPVKRYSSGMYVRLAFAVAAHLDPEILVVDEVLAVGDASFRSRCLNRMQAAASGGRTVVFVSHDLAAIEGLTTRCLLLRSGSIAARGDTPEVIEEYLSGITTELTPVSNKHVTPTKLNITRVGVFNNNGVRSIALAGRKIRVEVEYESSTTLDEVRFDIGIYDHLDRIIALLDSESAASQEMHISPGAGCITCEIEELPLMPGRYHVNAAILCRGMLMSTSVAEAFLNVEAGDYFGTGRIPGRGVVLLKSSWSRSPGLRKDAGAVLVPHSQ